MTQLVVNLERERRKRRGLRPTLKLIGTCSTIKATLLTGLSAVDPDERPALLRKLLAGTYGDMIQLFLADFEVENFDSTQAIG